jgi:hypothetical protein
MKSKDSNVLGFSQQYFTDSQSCTTFTHASHELLKITQNHDET